MAINKVKYGEYMISLLRCHTGRGQGQDEARQDEARRVRMTLAGGVAWGRTGGQCPSGPIVVNRKLKTAIK